MHLTDNEVLQPMCWEVIVRNLSKIEHFFVSDTECKVKNASLPSSA